MMKRIAGWLFPIALVLGSLVSVSNAHAQSTPAARTAEQSMPVEWAYNSQKSYNDPFNEVDVDVVFTHENGQQWRVPAFWAGGNEWKVRFAPPLPGTYQYHAESTDKSNPDLNGHEGTLRVEPYRGSNLLLMHGALRVGPDHHHFEFADGTPFMWLGDTWWKGLCRRISLDGFNTLAADRQAKGFDVVQIVAGLYPDEPPFDDRGKNEGGFVWEPGFTRINPAYFDAADARIQALVNHEMVPAIVGSWGYYYPLMGRDKVRKHWRNLVARYGAYPVVWILAGESAMPYYLSSHPKEDAEMQRKGWTEIGKYVRSIDPYGHMITVHPTRSARSTEVLDESVIDFDMLQTGHRSWSEASNMVAWLSSHVSKTPPMPVLVGESFYEGHQQTNWQDIQRFAFWTNMMNGAAGHTYGAGGIWQMNGTTVPHGPSPWGITYENTPWNVAMHLPGSTQMGIGKSILMKYPWWRFQPHPEWVEPHSTVFTEPHADWFDPNKRWEEEKGNYLLPYASGIPGEIRFIYIPAIPYTPMGPLVTDLENGVTYHAEYYDPVTGEKYNLGKLLTPPLTPVPEDSFSSYSGWVDAGAKTSLRDGKLLTNGTTWTTLKSPTDADVLVRVEAKSNAEAGVLLRFQDTANTLVAVYSPRLKGIWIQDRKNGEYGSTLGFADVREIGPDIHLVAEARGSTASVTISDGKHTYQTRPVTVTNTRAGGVGVWDESLACQTGFFGGCRESPISTGDKTAQTYSNFSVSKIGVLPPDANSNLVILNAWRAPNLPLSHDWVLVLER